MGGFCGRALRATVRLCYGHGTPLLSGNAFFVSRCGKFGVTMRLSIGTGFATVGGTNLTGRGIDTFCTCVRISNRRLLPVPMDVGLLTLLVGVGRKCEPGGRSGGTVLLLSRMLRRVMSITGRGSSLFVFGSRRHCGVAGTSSRCFRIDNVWCNG